MRLSLLAMIAFWIVPALAATHKIVLPDGKLQLQRGQATVQGEFTKVSADGFSNLNQEGAPSLPVKSWLVQGKPSDIKVDIQTSKMAIVKSVRPLPVQPQDCRCDTPKKPFAFDQAAYSKVSDAYTLTYIGAFRGQPITRIDVPVARYLPGQNAVQVNEEMTVQVSTPDYDFRTDNEYKDYFIITPESLAPGLTAFVDYKKSRGFNVKVATLSSTATLVSLSQLIRDAYTNDGADFVMLIGNETTLPMYSVSTSGSSQTPSDLKYFTMDGVDDTVPDMFGGRIAATTSVQVAAQLQKAIDFEQNATLTGRKNFIGIASSEGSGPSDKEYVESIRDSMLTNNLVTNAAFLYQRNTDSTPTTLNNKFNDGALWLTYVGHGSGTSWPSMYSQYSVSNIAAMRNEPSFKPIIIDVACQNGRLNTANFGVNIMKTGGTAFGAAAYYGGTVNVSWDPPAIMAQGISFEHGTKHFKSLGEALLAGQLYLASHWTQQAQVVDNFEWYHLQGDPGMSIQF